MKRYNQYIIIFLLLGLFFANSCTNLDEEYYDVVPQNEYGQTQEQLNSLLGPVYTDLKNYVDFNYWMAEATSDEMMVPSKGKHWYSGGVNIRRHMHQWSALETINFWSFKYITAINKIMHMLDGVEIANKERVFAELRAVRAFWYFRMIDTHGTVPIVDSFTISELPSNASRTEVYNFIEQELLAVVEDLPEEVSTKTYAKFTKWAGYTLLAKLYLNAEVYTGAAQWQKCIEACEKIVASGKYQLEEDFFSNFKVNNEGSKENIFVIPFDMEYFKGFRLVAQTLHYGSVATYDLLRSPWNGFNAVPSFVKRFDTDDLRYGTFIIGEQYTSSGEPIKYGANKVVLNYTVDVDSIYNIPEHQGARIGKWEFERGGDWDMNNDFAVYRYADVLLMKAEASLRLGDETTALQFVNQVRARAFEPNKPLNTIDLDLLYNERGFEMAFEGWRRQDQIRFGKFLEAWDFKPESDGPHRNLFPIAQKELDKNPNLTQVEGY